MRFHLPPIIRELVAARNQLRDHFANGGLRFTFDGNLVGDLGEAVAANLFGLELVPRCGTGIDGHAPDGRSVQVKATGTGRGPAFRFVDTRADHLIVMSLDFDEGHGDIVYNGPEHLVIGTLPMQWTGQRCVPLNRVRSIDQLVSPELRLPQVR